MPQESILEFSRPIRVAALESALEITREIEADESERAALAARLELVRLDSLVVEVTLRRKAGKALIRVNGHLLADVVQSCVATMAPVPGRVDQTFDEIFAPEGYDLGEYAEDDDRPEYFDGHEIDIGELSAQILSLFLDPYPRAPDVEPAPGDEDSVSERRRPFAGLGEMLKKGE